MEEVSKKALNLKVKANRSSQPANFWESADEEQKKEIEKQEMIKEIRDMKNGVQQTMGDVSSAIKDMN